MTDESNPPENKTERVHLLMSPSEVKAIDDWGFANRIRTRAEAVRRLCHIGLALDEQSAALRPILEDLRRKQAEVVRELRAHIHPHEEQAPSYSQLVSSVLEQARLLRTFTEKADVLISSASLLKDEEIEDIEGLVEMFKEISEEHFEIEVKRRPFP
jgi:hypothetical protein